MPTGSLAILFDNLSLTHAIMCCGSGRRPITVEGLFTCAKPYYVIRPPCQDNPSVGLDDCQCLSIRDHEGQHLEMNELEIKEGSYIMH